MTALLCLNGARAHDTAIDAWLQAKPAELAAIARRCGPDVTELMHDGQAAACIGDAAFGCVGVYAAHVNVGIFQGASLPDPAMLLQGAGRFMRHVKLRPGQAVDEAALEALIEAAYRDIARHRPLSGGGVELG